MSDHKKLRTSAASILSMHCPSNVTHHYSRFHFVNYARAFVVHFWLQTSIISHEFVIFRVFFLTHIKRLSLITVEDERVEQQMNRHQIFMTKRILSLLVVVF